MAVEQATVTESHTGTTGSTSVTNFTFEVPYEPNVRGVLVFTFVNANADDATSVTHGGVNLTAVSGGRAVDTATEPGDCKAWVLGAGIPVSITGGTTVPSGVWSGARDSFPFPIDGQIQDMASNGNWYLAVGNGTTYNMAVTASATAGRSGWVGLKLPITGTVILCVCGDSSTNFVVGTNDGEIWTCSTSDPTNISNWTSNGSAGFGAAIDVRDIATDGTTWVGVGEGGAVRTTTSPSGTWTAASAPGFSTDTVSCVYTDGTTWVAGGEPGVTGSRLRTTTTPTTTWSAPTAVNTVGILDRAVDIVKQGTNWICAFSSVICTTTTPTGTWAQATADGFKGVATPYSLFTDGTTTVCTGEGGRIRTTTTPTTTWSAATYTGFDGIVYCGLNAGANTWLAGGATTGGAGNGMAPNAMHVRFAGSTQLRVNRNNTVNEMWAVCIQLRGDADLSATGVVLLQNDATLAVQAVTDGSPGTSSLRFAACNSGLASVSGVVAASTLAPGTGSQLIADIDFGTRVIGVVREINTGQGSRNVGFSAATSDDVAAVHLAMKELPNIPVLVAARAAY